MSKPETDYIPFNDRLIGWMTRAALLVCCCLAVLLARQQAPEGEVLIWAAGLVIVAILEFAAWKGFGGALIEARRGLCLLYFFLAATMSLGTWMTNWFYSSVATNERAAVQMQSYNATTDLSRDEEELTAKRRRLEETVSKAPARTSEAAQAAIDNAKSHKFWSMTAECTATKGSQTRQFCADYAAAVADKSNAAAAVQARADLANTENRLEAVREKRATSKGEISKEDPTIAGIMTRLNVDADTARMYKSMILPTLLQIALIIGGLLDAATEARNKEAKSWLPKWFSNWVKGRAYVAATGRQLKSADEVYEAAAQPSHGQRVTTLVATAKTPEQVKLETQRDHIIAIAKGQPHAS